MATNMLPYPIENRGPNILIRLIWFILVGWWLGGVISALAWFLNATIIGLPIGLWLINRLPTFITLRPQEQSWRLESGVYRQGKEQQGFLLRAAYFLLVGWWLSGVWMALAYGLLLTVILLPVSFWMYGRIGAITTLYRS